MIRPPSPQALAAARELLYDNLKDNPRWMPLDERIAEAMEAHAREVVRPWREALAKYGGHTLACRNHVIGGYGYDCECGFSAARALLLDATKETP